MSAHAPLDARTLCSHPLGWVATGLGSGLSPRAPGTAGSIAALLPWLLLARLDAPVYLMVVAATFVLGTWASNWVIARTGVHDPGAVVIDEWVGLWIALFLVPAGWPWALLGLVAFRFFDILKPWPIGWLDRRVKGGFGVMVDDVLAGLMALGVVQGVWWLLKAGNG
ncbi:MAG: phosphatidylglycerophosphatase A family protein [Lysobacteraceae bacterium]